MFEVHPFWGPGPCIWHFTRHKQNAVPSRSTLIKHGSLDLLQGPFSVDLMFGELTRNPKEKDHPRNDWLAARMQKRSLKDSSTAKRKNLPVWCRLSADPPPLRHCSRNLLSKLWPPLARIAWTASVLMPFLMSRPSESCSAQQKTTGALG